MYSSRSHGSSREPPHLACLDGFSLDDPEIGMDHRSSKSGSYGNGPSLYGHGSHETHSGGHRTSRNYDNDNYSNASSASRDSSMSRPLVNRSSNRQVTNPSKRLSFRLPTPAQVLSKMAYVALYADVNLMTAIPAFGDASLISTFLEMTKSLGSHADEISSFSTPRNTISPLERTLREALSKSSIPIARILFHEPSLQELADGSFLRLHSAFFNSAWTVLCDDLTPENIIKQITSFTDSTGAAAAATSPDASSGPSDPSRSPSEVGNGLSSENPSPRSSPNTSTPDILIEAFAKIGMPPEHDVNKSPSRIFSDSANSGDVTPSLSANAAASMFSSKVPGPLSSSDVQEAPWKVELSRSSIVLSPMENAPKVTATSRDSTLSAPQTQENLPMQFSNSFGVWSSRVHPEDRPGLYKACGKAIILRLPSFHLRCRWSIVNFWKLVDLDYSLEYGPTGVLRAVTLMVRPVENSQLEPLDASTGRNWFQQILPANQSHSASSTPQSNGAMDSGMRDEPSYDFSESGDGASTPQVPIKAPLASGTHNNATSQSAISQDRKNRNFSRSPASPYLRSTRLRKEDSVVRQQYVNSRPMVARISANTDMFGVSFDTPPLGDELLTIGLPRLPQFDYFGEAADTPSLDDPVHDWSSPTALDACFDMLLASKREETAASATMATDSGNNAAAKANESA